MSDLVEFLRARLADDERWARRALEAAPPPWERRYDQDSEDRWMDIQAADGTSVADTESGALGPPLEVAEHIARHDPARVLAEVEAKRRIIEEHPLTDNVVSGVGDFVNGFGCETCHEHDGEVIAYGYCTTLKALALPHADHPDYREEWRP